MTDLCGWGEWGAALAGAAAGGLAACLPGVHVTLVMALAAALTAAGCMPASSPWPFAAAAVGAYAILNGLPAIFLEAPDDSAAFSGGAVGRYADAGRHRDAFLLTVMGGVAALAILCGVFLAVRPAAVLRALRLPATAAPGLIWVGAILAATAMAPPGPVRSSAARAVGGVALFAACGLLGLAIHEAGCGPAGTTMLLVPCWAGLFTAPGLLTALLLPQGPGASSPARASEGPMAPLDFVRGLAAGLVSGAVVCVPGLTPAAASASAAGLAGPGDRVRLVALGAAKTGALTLGPLLAVGAGASLLRGSMAAGPPPPALEGGEAATAMLQTVFALLLGGGLAVAAAGPASRAAERIAERRRRAAAAVSAGCVALLVWVASGGEGLLVLATSTSLGMVPALFGLGRAGLLGVVLAPALLRVSGWGIPWLDGWWGSFG